MERSERRADSRTAWSDASALPQQAIQKRAVRIMVGLYKKKRASPAGAIRIESKKTDRPYITSKRVCISRINARLNSHKPCWLNPNDDRVLHKIATVRCRFDLCTMSWTVCEATQCQAAVTMISERAAPYKRNRLPAVALCAVASPLPWAISLRLASNNFHALTPVVDSTRCSDTARHSA